jgi:hypothetical protein
MTVCEIERRRRRKMSSLWNKLTDVVIGFGLHGPKVDLLENIQLSSNTNNSPRNHNATIVQDNIPSLATGSVSTKPKTKHKNDSSRRPQFQNTAPLQRFPHSPTGYGTTIQTSLVSSFHVRSAEYVSPTASAKAKTTSCLSISKV